MMKTLIDVLTRIFSFLILKPVDCVFFGCAGVLTRSMDDWRADVEAMKAVQSPLAKTNEDLPALIDIASPVMVNPGNWGESECLLLSPELPQEITPQDDFGF